LTVGASAYLGGSSSIQRLDPRAKVAGTLLFVACASLLPDGSWIGFGLLYLGWLGLVNLARVPLAILVRRSLWAAPFLLAGLVVPFATAGRPVLQIPLLGWTATAAGLVRGATLVVRTWISIQGFLLLAATTPPEDLFWSLQAFRFPKLLAGIILFSYRYLAVLMDEGTRMVRARRSRSAGPPSSVPLSFRVRSMGGLVGSLFLRALERSERVYAAMLSRGYDGQVRVFHVHKWRRRDSAALGLHALLLAALVLAAYGVW
jgi:cobalt/nickel transport system permease protein